MIVDERMVTYIRSLERPENPVIEAIEQEALDSFVPIIRKETQSFLKVMMLMNRPARVLEVGTAVGFSAILMSEYLPEGSHITTIENYEKRIPIARNKIIRSFQCLHHFQGIPFDQGDLFFFPCPFEIISCARNSFFIIFYRCDMASFRKIFAH